MNLGYTVWGGVGVGWMGVGVGGGRGEAGRRWNEVGWDECGRRLRRTDNYAKLHLIKRFEGFCKPQIGKYSKR